MLPCVVLLVCLFFSYFTNANEVSNAISLNNNNTENGTTTQENDTKMYNNKTLELERIVKPMQYEKNDKILDTIPSNTNISTKLEKVDSKSLSNFRPSPQLDITDYEYNKFPVSPALPEPKHLGFSIDGTEYRPDTSIQWPTTRAPVDTLTTDQPWITRVKFPSAPEHTPRDHRPQYLPPNKDYDTGRNNDIGKEYYPKNVPLSASNTPSDRNPQYLPPNRDYDTGRNNDIGKEYYPKNVPPSASNTPRDHHPQYLPPNKDYDTGRNNDIGKEYYAKNGPPGIGSTPQTSREFEHHHHHYYLPSNSGKYGPPSPTGGGQNVPRQPSKHWLDKSSLFKPYGSVSDVPLSTSIGVYDKYERPSGPSYEKRPPISHKNHHDYYYEKPYVEGPPSGGGSGSKFDIERPLHDGISPWKKIIKILTAFIPIGLLISALTPTVITVTPMNNTQQMVRYRDDDPKREAAKRLISSLAYFNDLNGERCEDRILCELLLSASNSKNAEQNVRNLLNNFTEQDENVAERAEDMRKVFDAVRNQDCNPIVCETIKGS